jgi:hypothetical protein
MSDAQLPMVAAIDDHDKKPLAVFDQVLYLMPVSGDRRVAYELPFPGLRLAAR